MDEGRTYVNVKLAKTGPESPSNDGMGSERPTGRDRSDPSIWLICVLTAILIMTGICWRIHVSQIRQSNETCHQNSVLSDLKRMRSDLRHQFTEMETKYRSVNETKAQICELLTIRRDQTCSQNWIRNKDRCYFISTFNGSYDGAKQHCSSVDSRLLEMNSHDEANFIYNSIHNRYRTYWIGKCEDRKVKSNLLYTVTDRKPTCTRCKKYRWNYNCIDGHYFICEKSAALSPDVLEKMLDICQDPMGAL